MDPQSIAFTPRDDIWRLSSTVSNVQQIQQEHADRLLRLERRQDEDLRMKSVWGPSSPFPNVLSGTPTHGPINQFENFDDDPSLAVVSRLHLDTDDEPRRLGATSRANSVRFDESANQSQWAHAPRGSIDLPPRSGSVLSGLGHPMFERTTSHKSDGKQSSAGQSNFSRANSLGVDSAPPSGHVNADPPALAPGLFILGTVPSIIRCWLSTSFKHDSLLYAAVCSGSYKSLLDIHLIHQLGFADQITHEPNGDRRIKLPLYLPEAVPANPSSSRANSPAPQLPSLLVDFTVTFSEHGQSSSQSIKIFLGSDMLRTHNADILFSSGCMTLYDSSRNKLSIPLVRPENKESFQNLYISSGPSFSLPQAAEYVNNSTDASTTLLNGLGEFQSEEQQPSSKSDAEIRAPSSDATTDASHLSRDSSPTRSSQYGASSSKASLTRLDTSSDAKEGLDSISQTAASASRVASSNSIWNNWRREGTAPSTSNNTDWASVSKGTGAVSQARPSRDAGIKVLRPSRQLSRTTTMASSSGAPSPSITAQPSRYFDEGRRRSGPGHVSAIDTSSSALGIADGKPEDTTDRRVGQGKTSIGLAISATTPTAATGKPRNSNPIGGGSAFSWLNPGQSK